MIREREKDVIEYYKKEIDRVEKAMADAQEKIDDYQGNLVLDFHGGMRESVSSIKNAIHIGNMYLIKLKLKYAALV